MRRTSSTSAPQASMTQMEMRFRTSGLSIDTEECNTSLDGQDRVADRKSRQHVAPAVAHEIEPVPVRRDVLRALAQRDDVDAALADRQRRLDLRGKVFHRERDAAGAGH